MCSPAWFKLQAYLDRYGSAGLIDLHTEDIESGAKVKNIIKGFQARIKNMLTIKGVDHVIKWPESSG